MFVDGQIYRVLDGFDTPFELAVPLQIDPFDCVGFRSYLESFHGSLTEDCRSNWLLNKITNARL